MSKLLVVAIAETWGKDDFTVVTYDLDDQQCKNIEIPRNQLFDSVKNKPSWDLFGETICNLELPPGNKLYQLRRDTPVKFVRYWPVADVQKEFKKRAISYSLFYQKRWSWAFVKISKVVDITFTRADGRIKSYITFEENGRNLKVLCKDFRWLHYWESIDQDRWPKKIQYWIQYLNQKNKSLYASAYFHTFPSGGKKHWFNGIHCFVDKS